MCRFTLYLGPPIRMSSLITEPGHSLIHQSYQSLEREEPLNGDGFGVAWYVHHMSEEPAVFRSITPAWNNRNLLELARIVESSCILAHVRAATQEFGVSENDCHPFRSGPYTFMHNGDVGGFAQVRRPLLAELSDESFSLIRGGTDSEHLFALFLDFMRAERDGSSADRMARALTRAIQRAVELVAQHAPGEGCSLNIGVSDGRHAVVSRFDSTNAEGAQTLYVNSGRRYVCDNGFCRMIAPETGTGAVVVSSERLSADPGWESIPPNHMVVIGADRSVQVLPCATQAAHSQPRP